MLINKRTLDQKVLIILLALIFIIDVSRGLILPSLVLYLKHKYHLPVKDIGLCISASLAVSMFFSMYAGYLNDKLPPSKILFLSMCFYAPSCLAILFSSNVFFVFISLATYNSAFQVFIISLKKNLSDLNMSKKFTHVYTAQNIGFTIGCAWYAFSPKENFSLPFIFSTILLFISLGITCFCYFKKIFPTTHPTHSTSISDINLAIRKDKSLLLFTLGCFFLGMVYKESQQYLSMYLVNFFSVIEARIILSKLMLINTIMIVLFQIFFSRNNSRYELIYRKLILSIIFLAIGIAGFAVSNVNVFYMELAMAVFSLGELIIVPIEFLFIDYIAPKHLRGIYYGVQNLSNISFLVAPTLFGFSIYYIGPNSVFYLLLLFSFIGFLLFTWGHLKKISIKRECMPLGNK
ncbi:hypothetical protein COMNV_00716 [Commensalibacter sp. Nvir]|uniref:MFS transporter n=1 Tax=Commensalibacter sp. Nvir TaxID=3069817 RepID=UPI002D7281A0|nr:hypothetical protein COMNV_00716 [Commensalibacter sp. Nvir]